jgi:hypothetical protein
MFTGRGREFLQLRWSGSNPELWNCERRVKSFDKVRGRVVL